MFKDARITNAGAALLAQWPEGGNITIEKAEAGTSTVTVSGLAEATDLSGDKHELSIITQVNSEAGLKLHLQFKPGEASYVAHQVGVWAKLDEGESTLIAIYQDDVGFEIPAEKDSAGFSYAFYATIAVDNTALVELNVDESAYVTMDTLTEVEDRLKKLTDNAASTMDDKLKAAQSAMSSTAQHAKDEISEEVTKARETMQSLLAEADMASYAKKTDLESAKAELQESIEAIPQSPVTVEVAADGWTLDAGGAYKHAFTAEGVDPAANLAYVVNLLQQGSEETDEPARLGWGNLIRGSVTAQDELTFWASEEPETAITVTVAPFAAKSPVTEVFGLPGGSGGGAGRDIEKATVTLSAESFVYNGTPQAPTVTKVQLGDAVLQENKDYYVIADKKTTVGEYSVIIAGIIDYRGSVSKPWSITRADPQLTLSAESATITGVMGSTDGSITVTHEGDGAISFEVTPTDTGDVTAELEGSKVKLTSVTAGTCTVKVKLAEGSNHTADEKSIAVTVTKATGKLSVAPTELTINGAAGTTATATLTITGEAEPDISYDGGETTYSDYFTVERAEKTLTLTSVAATESPVTLTITMAASDNYTAASCTLKVTVTPGGKIYGVEWDRTASTKWTRTDAATMFGDPSPALSNGSGSSPFDDILPWSGMKKVTKDGNSLVEIPKFYFKWTDGDKLKLQISPDSFDGAHVSPAHADRGDGKGERDKVYIGRYHCNETDYKSTTGALPKVSTSRGDFRTAVTALSSTESGKYYLMDYAMLWTIRMLYLVEFADWDCQAAIGFDCGNSSKVEESGKSDAATYHTGTALESRETYGLGVQYRNIEDMWGNCFDWCDGITYDGNKGIYVCNNPTKYSDTTADENYKKITTVDYSGGWIQDWFVPTEKDYEWALFPKSCVSSGGDGTNYVADGVSVSSCVVVYVCGYCSTSRYYGLFFSYGDLSVGSASSYIGARLQYLP